MIRDIAQVRAATELVAADLRRVFGAAWTCRLGDDWVLAVSDGTRVEESLLDADVQDEAWYVDARWSAEQQRAALEADATEAVASETLELISVLGVAGPTCPAHGGRLGTCEGVWYCGDSHDVAFVGRLVTAEPFADDGEAE